MKKIKRFIAKVYIAFLKLLPIKKNRIYFVSNFGTRVACNPKAFFDYLYNNHKSEFDFYYCLNSNNGTLPSDVKTAKYKSLKDLYYLYTSKYIVNNFRFHTLFSKRKSQVYVQTWHGGPVPQKKIEKDAEKTLNEGYIKEAKNDSQNISLLLTGSTSIQEIFSKGFWYDGEVCNFGTPRYDLFFNENTELKNKLREQFNISADSIIVLYAPTFRNNTKPEDMVLDNKTIVNALKKHFKKDIVLAYRFHPNQAKEVKDLVFEDEGVINLTSYPDSVDLEILSDILLTDFSSCLADFLVLNKPCFMIVKDYEEYLKNERGLYMSLEELPYPIFKSEKEFAEFLNKTNDIDGLFDKKIKAFSKKIGLSENGNACKSLYEKMKQL